MEWNDFQLKLNDCKMLGFSLKILKLSYIKSFPNVKAVLACPNYFNIIIKIGFGQRFAFRIFLVSEVACYTMPSWRCAAEMECHAICGIHSASIPLSRLLYKHSDVKWPNRQFGARTWLSSLGMINISDWILPNYSSYSKLHISFAIAV